MKTTGGISLNNAAVAATPALSRHVLGSDPRTGLLVARPREAGAGFSRYRGRSDRTVPGV